MQRWNASILGRRPPAAPSAGPAMSTARFTLENPVPTPASPPLAIIGIGCLFPGSSDFAGFWSRIVNKVDAVREVPPSHWSAADYLDPDPKAPDRVYSARGGFLDPVDFNPTAFGIPPSNLEATDSSQLLGLYVAQQALADCGYTIANGRDAAPAGGKTIDRARIGVILGVTGTLELVIPLGARLGHPIWRRALDEAGVDREVADDVVQRIADAYVPWQENSFPGLLGNVVAGRIANRFDLGGTNCVVDAACASSLSAMHLASLELAAGRADVVLTGGVDTFNDIFMFTCFSKTPALSPTGNARPFDNDANGTVLGEGLGIVVLKRLDDARRDGDRIYAVLRGVGSSSDGKGNAIYAPRKEGQIEALRTAYRVAGVTADTIELVEAHGTGTKVGDATEVSALTEVYRAAGATKARCALGSIKSQLGHTKAAAGVAGLIKAVAALYHKVLPPTIKVTRPLDILDGESPFYVSTEKRPWVPSPHHPRRAAVSAFGFGGSNFHCVLEEAGPEKTEIDWTGEVQIIAFHADGVAELKRQLAAWPANLEWGELRHRADRSRREFQCAAPCRLLVLVQREKVPVAELLNRAGALLEASKGKAFAHPGEGVYFGCGGRAGELAVLFPGQGAQYPGMLRDLTCHFPPAFSTLAAADRSFRAKKDPRLVDLIYPPPAFTPEAKRAQEEALRATDMAQPALGAVSLGAWRVLESFGVRAGAYAGHSYGELTALCAAGRLAEEEFHALSQLRGGLMADAGRTGPDAGGMLAVKAREEQIVEVLREEGIDLVLANKNTPSRPCCPGRRAVIDRAVEAFARRKITTVRLSVAAAFHSALVAAAREPFLAALAGIPLPPGRAPVYANTTAAPYPADAGEARELLGNQLARPVEWVKEVEALYAAGCRSFLEVGPGGRLTGMVEAILSGRDAAALAVDASSGQRGGVDLAGCLAWLASRGHEANLAAWEPARRQAISPAASRPTPFLCAAPTTSSRARPPLPPRRTSPAQHQSSVDLSPASNGTTPMMNHPTPPQPIPPSAVPAAPDGAAVAQALQITRESLLALQKMQEQTAQSASPVPRRAGIGPSHGPHACRTAAAIAAGVARHAGAAVDARHPAASSRPIARSANEGRAGTRTGPCRAADAGACGSPGCRRAGQGRAASSGSARSSPAPVGERPGGGGAAGGDRGEDGVSGGDAGTGDGAGRGPGHRLHQARGDPLGTAGTLARRPHRQARASRFAAHPARHRRVPGEFRRASARRQPRSQQWVGGAALAHSSGRTRPGRSAGGDRGEDGVSGGDAGAGDGAGRRPGHRLHQARGDPVGAARTLARCSRRQARAPRLSPHPPRHRRVHGGFRRPGTRSRARQIGRAGVPVSPAGGATEAESAKTRRPAPPAGPPLERSIVRVAPLPSASAPDIRLPPGAEVWISDEDAALARALRAAARRPRTAPAVWFLRRPGPHHGAVPAGGAGGSHPHRR